jgi:hypothetical protein
MVRTPEGEPVLRVFLRYPAGPREAAVLRVIREAGLSLALPRELDVTGLEVSFVLPPEGSHGPTGVSWAVTGTRAQRAAAAERIEALMRALKVEAACRPESWGAGATSEG